MIKNEAMITPAKPIFVGLSFIALMGCCYLIADVTSTSGNLSFDSNDDTISEMNLNSTGLHIGVGTASSQLSVAGNAIISGELGVGGVASSSNFHLHGSIGFSIHSISANASLDGYSYHLANTSSNSFLLTLPKASFHAGQQHTIKKVSSNNDVVIRAISSNITPYSPLVMSSNTQGALPFTSLMSDGSSWHVTSASPDVGELASTNLVYHFKFDETSGNTVLDSKGSVVGASNDGLIQSAPGMVGSSLSFTGSGNRLAFTSNQFKRPSYSYTLTMWIKFDQQIKDQRIIQDFDYNGGAHYGYQFKMNSSGDLIVYSGNGTNLGGATATITNAQLDPLNWHHWVFCISEPNGILSAYKDGALLSISDNTMVSGLAFNSNCQLNISLGSSVAFEGDIDDLRLYDRKLNAEEALWLYQSGNVQ